MKINELQKYSAMITKDKVTEIFCIIDEFDKNLDMEMRKNLFLPSEVSGGKRRRNRKGRLSRSEIMTILVSYHFGTYRNFKEYYLKGVLGEMRREFPDAVSYNRFVELMPRVFIEMLLFMRLYAFGKCTGITFVDSTMIPVCHNVRRYFNKVFAGLAKDGKGTMGWCHGFKLHLMCNDRGDIITFCLTGANVDDRDIRVWKVFEKELYGKVFADRGYIKKELFESLFDRGIHLVHGLRANMKNRLMSMWDKIMLRKRYVIECINELLKNKANLVHSRHRYTISSSTSAPHSRHIVSLTTSRRLCQYILKERHNWSSFDFFLIPNWRKHIGSLNKTTCFHGQNNLFSQAKQVE